MQNQQQLVNAPNPAYEATAVFEAACKAGVLSHNAGAGNYVDKYMFMGVFGDEVHFKHVGSRKYLIRSIARCGLPKL